METMADEKEVALRSFKNGMKTVRTIGDLRSRIKTETRPEHKAAWRAALYASAFALATSAAPDLVRGVPNPSQIDLNDAFAAPYIGAYEAAVNLQEVKASEESAMTFSDGLEAIVGSIDDKKAGKIFDDKRLQSLAPKELLQWYAGYDGLSKAYARAEDLVKKAGAEVLNKDERGALLVPLVEKRVKDFQSKLKSDGFSLDVQSAAANVVRLVASVGNHDKKLYVGAAEAVRKDTKGALSQYVSESGVGPTQYVQAILAEAGSSQDPGRFNTARELAYDALA